MNYSEITNLKEDEIIELYNDIITRSDDISKGVSCYVKCDCTDGRSGYTSGYWDASAWSNANIAGTYSVNTYRASNSWSICNSTGDTRICYGDNTTYLYAVYFVYCRNVN